MSTSSGTVARPQTRNVVAIALCAIALLGFLVTRLPEPFGRGLLVAGVLSLLTALVVLALPRVDSTFKVVFVLLVVFKLPLMGTVGQGLYESIARTYDGNVFHSRALEPLFRHPGLTDLLRMAMPVFGESGSSNLHKLLALMYRLSYPEITVGHVFFAFMGVWGIYFYYRALRVAFPRADWRPLVFLLILTPSIFAYTSLLLKDGPSFLSLGLLFYGVALFYRGRRPSGIFAIVLAHLGLMMFRPHMLVITIPALSVGLWFEAGRRGYGFSSRAALLVATALLVYGVIQRVLWRGEEDILARLATWRAAGLQGGNPLSTYEIASLAGATYLPYNMFTVLFRPLPTEVVSIAYLPAGVEGLALLGLFCWIVYLLAQDLRRLRDPLTMTLVGFVLIFATAFAFVVGNLNNAVRMKLMVAPVIYLLATGLASSRSNPAASEG